MKLPKQQCRSALGICRQTLWNWQHGGVELASSETGNCRAPWRTKLLDNQAAQMVQWFLDTPCMSQSQAVKRIGEEFNIAVSQPFVSRLLSKKKNITRKKASKAYTESDPAKVAEFLAALQDARGISPDGLLNRRVRLPSQLRPKGERAVVLQPGRRGQRFSLLQAVDAVSGVFWHRLFPGSVNAQIFQGFVAGLPVACMLPDHSLLSISS